jgi:AraC-like DNA-binding protein
MIALERHLPAVSEPDFRHLEQAVGAMVAAAAAPSAERLAAAQTALADPANRRSIAALAEEFCFADASSFNRSFRRAFGCSPGEARSAALAGLQLPALRQADDAATSPDFGGLLRRF